MIASCRARAWVVALAVTTTVAVTVAQTPPRLLSVDTIYHPALRENFSGVQPPDVAWLNDTSYLTSSRTAAGTEWLRVDAASGRTTPFFDLTRMELALAALPGMTRNEVADVFRSGSLVFNATNSAVVITIGDDLYAYDFGSERAVRLTTMAGEEEEPSFSPDGRLVSFVRAHNLYVVDVATQHERALTTDGGAEVLNGTLDWVYQEEIYGRGTFRAYWWSPDSSTLAFLQLNEHAVPVYTLVDHLPFRPAVETENYPKAGDPNPDVRLGVVRASGGGPVWADVTPVESGDLLVVDVDWTPDSSQVAVQLQDREQTWLDLNLVNAESGTSHKVLRETTKAWVNNNGSPVWLKDGSFLWISERSGFRHLYRYRTDGTLVRQITSGRWDLRSFYGVDEATSTVYFAGTERSPIGMDIYRVTLDGTGLTRLSTTTGWHRAIFNATYTRYVDVWSDATTPTQVRLHDRDGRALRVISDNPVPGLERYPLSAPEFVQVPTRDGFVMEGMLIKPPDFDPARRYPVYQFTYGGPGTQSVLNRWGGTQYMYYQLLAEHGIVVWVLDNRSASGKGVESQWPVYGRLGELELQDLEDGATWLKRQSYIDPDRFILDGWSYGGFMSAYALTHSTTWSAGVVGAPVTDWRDYDTIYTERLMKTPEHNPDGYRRSAPRLAAGNLHGRMLLIHGTMDDNVHMQNSEQFAYELQKAGKAFEMMIYPRQRHAFSDPLLNTHVRQLMFDFIVRSASAPVSTPATAAR